MKVVILYRSEVGEDLGGNLIFSERPNNLFVVLQNPVRVGGIVCSEEER